MKIIAVIPARYNASRFPGKLMAKLGDTSVILRTYMSTVNTKLFEEVFVVTDSLVILDEIQKNGGKSIMSKRQHECGSDRIAEAIEDMNADIIVNVQGDEPFVNRDALKKIIEVFKTDHNREISVSSLMQEFKNIEEVKDPNFVKVVVDKDNFAMYFSRSPIPYCRDESASIKYYEHIGVYAFRKDALLDFYKMPMKINEVLERIEAIRYLEYGKKIKMIETKYVGVEIDTPEDLKMANDFLNQNPHL